MKHLVFKATLGAAFLCPAMFGHADTLDNARQIAPADGWASVAGGTLGGSAALPANIYTVATRAQLLGAINNGGTTSKIIKLVGIIDMSEGVAFSGTADQATRGAIPLNSNTTLIGDGANSGIVNGQIQLAGVSQVIIRNLKIVNPCDVGPVLNGGIWTGAYDGISLSASSHVWIDHNSFSDVPNIDNQTPPKQCHDGALDITNASDYVTVSYNAFGQHTRNNLIGASDTATLDDGHLRVTFSNNVFSDIASAAPQVRYGLVHLFNNYYLGNRAQAVYPNLYSVGAGKSAKILSTNNVFEIAGAASCDAIVQNPVSGGEAGAFKDSGSTLNGKLLLPCSVAGNVTWAVPYAYAPRPIALVKANALAQAGGGKLTTAITGTGNTGTALSGVALDGYLSNALVFLDANDNGKFDTGEASTTTDAAGKFVLTVPAGQSLAHAVVVTALAGQTIDLDYPGKLITQGYTLMAPVGMTAVISPLTTLIAARMSAGLTLDQAAAAVRSELGLASDANLFADYMLDTSKPNVLHNLATATAEVLKSVAAASTASTALKDALASVASKYASQVAPYAASIKAAADPAAAALVTSYAAGFKPAVLTAATCTALQGTTIPATAFSLATGGATISAATFTLASASGNIDGNFCKLIGTVNPQNASGSGMAGSTTNTPIGFEINLPAAWNGKFVHQGGGGFDGTLADGSSGTPGPNGMSRLDFAPTTSQTPLLQGYMTFGDDSGHLSSITTGTFAANDEALQNYGRVHLKKTLDAALYLIQNVYKVPRQLKGYFVGSSTGGRDGFAMIQNWPENYDAIFVNRPAHNYTGLRLSNVQLARSLWLNSAGAASAAGWINSYKTTVLMNAVMSACDGLDGLVDGIISDLDACKAKSAAIFTAITCAGGGDTGNTCLSNAQIATVKTMSSPLVTTGYALANGVTSYGGYNIMAGMVFGGPAVTYCSVTANNVPAYGSPYASRDFGPSSTGPVLSSTGQFSTLFSNWCLTTAGGAAGNSPNAYQTGSEWVKYFIARQTTNFDPRRMDPATGIYAGTPAKTGSTPYAATAQANYAQRIADVSAMTDATSTNLDAFINKGGKIIWTHGSADEVVSTDSSVDYYKQLVAKYGQSGVDAFARFYIINGNGHGDSGPFIPVFDSLLILSNWAEQNIDPADNIVMGNKQTKSALDTTAGGKAQRPMCRYPTWPKYAGFGDSNLASSFSCVAN